MGYSHILVASHGTPGARAAEALALDLAAPGGRLTHLYAVEEFWLGMRGDDWLNNVAGRQRFERHLEGELQSDMEREFARFGAAAAARGLTCDHRGMVGRPEAGLVALAAAGCDLVVVGAPRPKGVKGFRSRLGLEPLVKALTVPLLVAPHPGR